MRPEGALERACCVTIKSDSPPKHRAATRRLGRGRDKAPSFNRGDIGFNGSWVVPESALELATLTARNYFVSTTMHRNSKISESM